jgi:hypothetical protein
MHEFIHPVKQVDVSVDPINNINSNQNGKTNTPTQTLSLQVSTDHSTSRELQLIFITKIESQNLTKKGYQHAIYLFYGGHSTHSNPKHNITRKLKFIFETGKKNHCRIKITYFFLVWSTLPLGTCLRGLLRVTIIFS